MGFQPFPAAAFRRLALIAVAAACLAACQDSGVPKQLKPVPHALVADMERLEMKETSKIFVRLYKETSELEIWKERQNGTFALLKTYSICKWSGALGPKKKEGDRQAPEGVYIVTPAQMNPNSSYYLSFNIGYPNAFDRSLDRTGSNLMVHGACSSSGCYSMTDEDAGEIFALARDSFRGGQTSFQIQALPFRMTAENLARHRDDPNMPFWRMLKVGADNFDLTLRPPKVDVCEKRYVFNADAGGASFNASGPCPQYSVPEALTTALAKKQAQDDADFVLAITQLEAAKKNAADEAIKVAEEEKEKAAREAERATQPSLVQRIVNKFTGRGEEPPAEEAATPVATAAPTPVDPPKVATNSVPVPRLRPPEQKSTTVAAGAATAEPASTGAITPEMTPAIPTVGKFVKKKFLWPGEDGAADAPAPAGQSL
jgi:murein L,D-transpeptidase YafK